MITRKGDIYFLADTSVNIEPTAEDLVEIAETKGEQHLLAALLRKPA